MTKLFCALQAINVENEIVINPGDHESLTVEGPADVLDRIETGVQGDELHIRLGGGWTDKIRAVLATGLTRPHVTYNLTVKTLSGLDVEGLVRLRVADVETDRLAVKFRGIGHFNIPGLTAQRRGAPGVARILAGAVV